MEEHGTVMHGATVLNRNLAWLNGVYASVQVVDVCRRANPRLVIKRAKFSALVRRELERSVQTLGLPDENSSKAVDARQEIDLRIGASFTRFQTLLLQVHRHAHV